MNKTRRFVPSSDVVALSALVVAIFAASAHAVTIPTVPVGNAGNADDTHGAGYGGVAYDYRIGTYEVTNAQYAEFLNAKAASDPLGLYDTSMGSDVRGGINRSGSDGSYTYTLKTHRADKPVIYVSALDAVRFVNWLHNGQGSGDTETGAYTVSGISGNSLARNPGATWFLPSEDEWYKAAYYDPTLASGSGDYWDYPTRSNSAPTIATANSDGDISNPGANVANYLSGADWNGLDGNVTTIGSAGPLSESYYGTSDQGGNVWEMFQGNNATDDWGWRGGSWHGIYGSNTLQASVRFTGSPAPSYPGPSIGFRVATVPEPSTAVLGMIGFALTLWWWRGRN